MPFKSSKLYKEKLLPIRSKKLTVIVVVDKMTWLSWMRSLNFDEGFEPRINTHTEQPQ